MKMLSYIILDKFELKFTAANSTPYVEEMIQFRQSNFDC